MEQNLIAALKIVMSKDFLTKLGNGVKTAVREADKEQEAEIQGIIDDAKRMAEEWLASVS